MGGSGGSALVERGRDARAAGVDERRAGGQPACDTGESVWLARLQRGVRLLLPPGDAGGCAEPNLRTAGDALPRSLGFPGPAAGAGERGRAGVAAAVLSVRDGVAGVGRGPVVPVAARC